MAIAADVNEYAILSPERMPGRKKFKQFIFLLADPSEAQETLAGLKNGFDLDLARGNSWTRWGYA